MIDLKDLREDPAKYRRGAELKNVKADIDSILALDEQWRASQGEFERLRAEQNVKGKEVAALKDPQAKKAAVAAMGELKARMKEAEERAGESAAQRELMLLQVPQPPDADVPAGKDASDNVVARKWGTPRAFDFKPKTHIELGEALGILDFKAGVRLAGSRSYFLKGAGADLHHAVLRLRSI